MDLVIHQHYAKLRPRAQQGIRIAVLRIGDSYTRIAAGMWEQPDAVMVLPWGSNNLATTCFKGRMPSPLAMENAIMAVEDALMAARNPAVEQLPLYADDELLQRLAKVSGLTPAPGSGLALDDVERVFNQLADHAQGRPMAHSGFPEDPQFAAYLLILRECMHHLRFNRIHITE